MLGGIENSVQSRSASREPLLMLCARHIISPYTVCPPALLTPQHTLQTTRKAAASLPQTREMRWHTPCEPI